MDYSYNENPDWDTFAWVILIVGVLIWVIKSIC